MKNNKKAISLIVLVITIVLILILAGAVILNFSNNNPIDTTKKNSLLSTFDSIKERYELYLSKDIINKNANTLKTPTDKLNLSIEQCNEILKLNETKYTNRFLVLDGVLCYLTNDEEEKELLTEITFTPTRIKLNENSDVIYDVTMDETSKIAILNETDLFLYNFKLIHSAINNYQKINNTTCTIGTPLSTSNYVSIRGLTYAKNWYKLSTDADFEALGIENPGFGDYIYNPYYEAIYLLNVNGKLINDTPIHFLEANYSPTNVMVVNGLLSGVDESSVKNTMYWGELTLQNSGSNGTDISYDENDGLNLTSNSKVAVLPVDQSKPINQQFSVMFTVKGPTTSHPFSSSDGYARTIVAISDKSSQYVCWIGISKQYLHVYTYRGSPKANLLKEYTEAGFTSIDVAKYDNKYMNIQVTAKRGNKTKVYINGTLANEFTSGSSNYSYKSLTIGDLRPGRGLKYTGTIYNFGLYSEILSESEIQQNWDVSNSKYNIE